MILWHASQVYKKNFRMMYSNLCLNSHETAPLKGFDCTAGKSRGSGEDQGGGGQNKRALKTDPLQVPTDLLPFSEPAVLVLQSPIFFCRKWSVLRGFSAVKWHVWSDISPHNFLVQMRQTVL